MNADVLQKIFEFAGVEERIQMRKAFGELFRYPRVRFRDISVKQTGEICVYRFRHTLVVGQYRIEKSICAFGGHERVETFIGEHGMYANKRLGALCILLWCVRPACIRYPI